MTNEKEINQQREERRERIREEARCVLRKRGDIKSLCHALKINQTTLNEWERKDEEFRFIVGEIREGLIENKKENVYVVELPPEEKFNPEYHPKKAYDMFKEGCTPAQVRKELKVTRKTIDRWRASYPVFDYWYSLGFDASQANWEALLRAGMMGNIDNFNPSIAQFLVKNIFKEDYTESKEININSTITNMTDTELSQRISAKLEAMNMLPKDIEGDYEEV